MISNEELAIAPAVLSNSLLVPPISIYKYRVAFRVLENIHYGPCLRKQLKGKSPNVTSGKSVSV